MMLFSLHLMLHLIHRKTVTDIRSKGSNCSWTSRHNLSGDVIAMEIRKTKVEWWQMNHKLQNFLTLSKHNHYQHTQLGLYRSGKKQNVEYGKNYNTLKNRKYRQDLKAV